MELVIDPQKLFPVRETDNDHLLGCVTIFGTQHHLGLVRIETTEDGQRAANEEDKQFFEDIWWIYEYPFMTTKIPGFDGEYVAIMHPYGN